MLDYPYNPTSFNGEPEKAMTVQEAIERRRSVHSYDPSVTIQDNELRDLLQLATLAPSSFNLNHWRFISVTSREGKQKLFDLSLNQHHIRDASAVLIILGKINAHEDVGLFIEDWIEKGYYPDDSHLRRVSEGFYGTRPEMQRDEAIRSTSIMAGMLMLAAFERGWSTAPIIGFNGKRLMEELAIPDNYLPVMLMTIGKELVPPPPRVKRLGLDSVMMQERFRLSDTL